MAISDDGMSSSESIGFGSQIGDSLKGILIGIVLFPLSFYCIFKVETCNQATDAFKKAKPVAQREEGKAIYVTGKLSANPIGSEFVKSGNYISISQSSQVYAWDEETKTEGTGSNKKKTKSCVKEWTSSPKDSSKFTLPGCKNVKQPTLTFKASSVSADGGKITADGKTYSVNLKEVKFSSAVKSQEPANENIITNGYTIGDKYLFERPDCASSTPAIGCERVDLSVTPIPDSDMTFLGDINGDKIVKYVYGDDQFLNASIGTYQQAMQVIKSDDSMMLWLGRGLAFVMMWSSFVLMSGPLMTLLEFIPFVGSFGAGAIRFVLGGIAFVLTAVTIILVKFWYVWLLIILAAIGFAIYKRKFAPQAPTT